MLISTDLTVNLQHSPPCEPAWSRQQCTGSAPHQGILYCNGLLTLVSRLAAFVFCWAVGPPDWLELYVLEGFVLYLGVGGTTLIEFLHFYPSGWSLCCAAYLSPSTSAVHPGDMVNLWSLLAITCCSGVVPTTCYVVNRYRRRSLTVSGSIWCTAGSNRDKTDGTK